MERALERKRYPKSGGNSYSDQRRMQQLLRRRPPALSTLYGGHQNTDEIEKIKKGVSNVRAHLPSTNHCYDDKSNRDRDLSSSSSSRMLAPQSTENRDRYIHPMLAGRFIPANEVRREKLDNVTPQSTPDLSEVYSHFSTGSSAAASQDPTDECITASKSISSGHSKIVEEELKAVERKKDGGTTLCDERLCPSAQSSWPDRKGVSSKTFCQEAIIDLNSDRKGMEGFGRLLLQGGRTSLGLLDDKIGKEVKREASEEREPSQTISDSQRPLKKRKSMHSPDESRNLCNIKVGSRVAVYWDGEDAYFEGTVTRERQNHKRRFFIEYDDGDQEWINFSKQRFHLVEQQTKRTVEERLPTSTQKTRPVTSAGNCKPSEIEISGGETKPVAKSVNCDSPRRKKQNGVGACDEWVLTYNNPKLNAEPSSSDDSETDEDEIMEWAVKMFGIQPPIARPKIQSSDTSRNLSYSASIQNGCVYGGISEAVKRRRSCVVTASNVQEVTKTGPQSIRSFGSKSTKHDKCTMRCRVKIRKPPSFAKPITEPDKDDIEAKRKKELARALTAEEIQSILGEDDCLAPCSTNWVRRSVRQPSKYALNSPRVKDLIEKLKSNDPDMVVLKMKKYVNDPNTPCLVIDAVLAALEENTNCEALYIQVSR